MERLRFRSTSMIDLMAELHEAELRAEVRRLELGRGAPVRHRARARARAFGLRLLGRRTR